MAAPIFSPIKTKKKTLKNFFSNKTITKTKKKTVKKRQYFDALKVVNNLNQLKVLSNLDFFVDPCRVLNIIKSKIKYSKWDSKTLDKMAKYIPKLKVNTFNPKTPYTTIKPKYTSIKKEDKHNGLVYGDILIYINRKISVGSHGEIYKGEMKYPNGNNKPIIIKILKGKGSNYFYKFLSESIIQNEIFCDQRKKIGKMYSRSIPKIEFIAKFKEKIGSTILESYMIGMEQLDGDFHHFNDIQISQLKYEKKPEQIGHIYDLYLQSLIQISQKIAQLQKDYQFNHNDLHMGNVMYKKTTKNGETVYDWYIIDFGMSCFDKDGIFMCADRYRTYNSSHDLRMLFTSLYENLPPRYVIDKSVTEKSVKYLSKSKKQLWKQEAFHIYINQVVLNMEKYADITSNPVFHKFYHQVKFYDDLNTIPSKVTKNLQNILNMKKGPRIEEGFMMDGEYFSESIISSDSNISISNSSSSDQTSSTSDTLDSDYS
jgi:hypothetical protein